MLGWLSSLFSRCNYDAKKKNFLSDKDKEHVVTAFKQGISRKQLAKDFDIGYSTVCRLIQDFEK